MINVRSLANMATQNVNPNISVVVRVNGGFVVNEYGEQVPSYSEHPLIIQTQSLSSREKESLDLINRQGEFISAYVPGDMNAIRRWVQKGSSKVVFPAYGEEDPVLWNVEQVIESFSTWTRVLLWRQS